MVEDFGVQRWVLLLTSFHSTAQSRMTRMGTMYHLQAQPVMNPSEVDTDWWDSGMMLLKLPDYRLRGREVLLQLPRLQRRL